MAYEKNQKIRTGTPRNGHPRSAKRADGTGGYDDRRLAAWHQRAKKQENGDFISGEITPEEAENVICGRNALLEALKSGRPIEKLFLRKGDREGSIRQIAALAAQAGIPFVETAGARLDAMTGTTAHQGVAALVSPVVYHTSEELLAMAAEKGTAPFFLLLDDIADPHNLGAILRSAECCGVNGVILPKRHSAPLSAVAMKASAGAANYLPMAKVTNLTDAIRQLQSAGVWVYAAEAGGVSLYKTDFTGPCAIVFGSEGKGISRLVKESCDAVVSIPQYGQINSFNVSCAAAILLSEAAHRRHSDA